MNDCCIDNLDELRHGKRSERINKCIDILAWSAANMFIQTLSVFTLNAVAERRW